MTNKRTDGGSAFPFGQISELTGHPINGYFDPGMSLRDYFAAKAMQGMLASDAHPDVNVATLMSTTASIRGRAIFAYAIADAMLAAREVQR